MGKQIWLYSAMDLILQKDLRHHKLKVRSVLSCQRTPKFLLVAVNAMCFSMRNINADTLIKCAGEILSELITSVETLGAAYEVLYVSDPFRSILYSHRELERFLVEGSVGNSTVCDEVCKIKSSLLEGVLVVSASFGVSFVFNY